MIVCIAALTSVTGSCNRQTIAASKAVSAFSDFTYVGSGQYVSSKNGINMTVAVHGEEPQAFPQHLETHVQYIFHHRNHFDTERFVLSELPSMLRRQGIVLTHYPHSARDMMFPYVGGPVFSIQFKEGAHSGIIFSQICPSYKKQVDSGWTGNDYVLVYLD
jgi:hypothetical protein